MIHVFPKKIKKTFAFIVFNVFQDDLRFSSLDLNMNKIEQICLTTFFSVRLFIHLYVCPLVCLSVSLSVGCPAMRERPFERESNLNLNRFRFLFFWPSQTSRKCFEDRTRFENTWKTDLRVWKRYWIQFKYFHWFN